MTPPYLLLATLFTTATLSAADSIAKDFWSADAIQWGDGRPYISPVPKNGPYPQGFKADFRLNIPVTGWYEVVYTNAKSGMRHDLLVDGKPAWYFRTTSAMGDDAKAGNLWLSAGEHVLRVQRVGRTSFPVMMIGGISLRPAAGRPEASISANKTRVDVVRAGEQLEITVTGGGAVATYEVLSANLQDPRAKPAVVASVAFANSSQPETRNISIPCPTEGAFALSARILGGKDLLASEFPISEYAVVDVAQVPQGGGAATPIQVLDCVAQTNQGAPIAAGVFLECNGPTRIVTSPAGTYRESHDSSPPEAAPMSRVDDPGSYSGFSYRFDLPQVQVPYLIDVEFPEDARRSVTISQNWIDETTGGFASNTLYSAKAYETGGMHPLGNVMCHHRTIVWAASKRLILGVLSQQAGQRAAVARITISRFAGDQVPTTRIETPGGRVFCHWYEEVENWRYLVNVAAAHPGGVVHDLVGLDRWVRICRYFGLNGISASGAGYQSAFWRTTTLEGVMPTDYDQCRLAALICEKYGMRYTPEVFPGQWYMNLVTLPALAERPEDVRSISSHGAERGPATNVCDLNPLHPVVQQAWIDGIGEMADKLRDCPAFAGVSVRADLWLFRGDYSFPSLNWGYGDWTISRFTRDTGIAVPGDDGDPERFLQRYGFLTGPAMRETWITWRCAGILDYHLRLRDRIRGTTRPDLWFGVAGDFRCDRCYQQPASIAIRARECGFDLAGMRKAGGLVVIANGRYGFRNLGVGAQRSYDDFLDPENVGIGMTGVRAFAAYMNYHELATFWPAGKLGVVLPKGKNPYYYCSAAIASGRNSLEKFAIVLAEQDSSFLRDGGNTDVYGDPEVWNPWFAEFRSLPALPFQAVEMARDPVAVWTRTLADEVPGMAPGFYFYAVNREQYPLRCDLRLSGADSALRLGTGERISGTTLILDLAPYELRSFRAGPGATLDSVTITVPPAVVTTVRNRLAFAQGLETALAGSRRADVSEAVRTAFSRQVEVAWQAVAQGHLWRARTALSMADAQVIYETLGAMPEGQVVTNFPGLIQESPNEGPWLPRRPVMKAEALARLAVRPVLLPSHGLDPAWRGAQVLMAENGLLTLTLAIPADGPYQLRLGHVAPAAGVTTVALDGNSLTVPIVTGKPRAPETAAFPVLRLKAGTVTLSLRRDGAFGLYALQLLPSLRPLPNPLWSVIGPFPSFWGESMAGRTNDAEALRKGFDTVFPPESEVDLAATYTTSAGKQVTWRQKTDNSIGMLDDLVVNMPIRSGSSQADINYAVTFITADAERTAQMHLGVDWWAVAWLNGERLKTAIDDQQRLGGGGADFNTHYPYSATLRLKKGVNTLLVKEHGGSQGSALAAWITDEPGISCTARADEGFRHQ